LKFIIDEAVEVGEKLPRWTTVHKSRERERERERVVA
jgi:hypothetical protein